MTAKLRSLIRNLRGRAAFETAMDDEMRFHLERRAEDLRRRGLSPAEAARQARVEFGSVEKQKDDARQSVGLRILDEIAGDLRYAFRTFAANKSFALTAVVTLALGIGANTAIFSLMDALVLRWLPVHRPQDLLMLQLAAPGADTGDPTVSYPLVRALDDRRDIFTSAAGYSAAQFTVGSGASMANVRAAVVTGAFYETLGLAPVTGRLLSRADDEPGAPVVAVVSYGYWERAFGHDPAIVGRTLAVNGVPTEVVGVSPRGFNGANVGGTADLTLAIAAIPVLQPEMASLLGPGNSWLRVLARTQPGISPAEGAARLGAAWPQVSAKAINPTWSATRKASITSVRPLLVSGGTGWTWLRNIYVEPLRILMGVVALVLLIACANVASLMLARAGARRKEFAVRLAIGARRSRIVRQLLVESAALALAGAAGGLFLARSAGELIVDRISTPQLQLDFDLTPNWHVFAFTTAVALATALIFGIAPAIQATATGATEALKDDHRTATSRSRLLPSLVAAQMALSLVLLIGAGLFLRTLRNLQTLDAGFQPEGVLFVELERRSEPMPLSILDDVRRTPGVISASVSTHTPLSGATWGEPVLPAGQPLPERDTAVLIGVSPGFFDTLRMRLAAGREFTAEDAAQAEPVAIVNERYAQKYFGRDNPIGRRLSAKLDGRVRELRIVGMAADAKTRGLRQPAPATVFLPYAQLTGLGFANVEVRTRASIADLTPALQRLLQPLQPKHPITVARLSEQVGSAMVQERMMATFATGFGLLALMLAAVGIYGLLAYAVARRTREIGIRVALGAQPRGVIALMLRGAHVPVLIGILAGAPAAWLVARSIQSMLFGLTPLDPIAIGGAILVLAVIAHVAAYLPAKRAAHVDPLIALRRE